jgi:hypothetical protein
MMDYCFTRTTWSVNLGQFNAAPHTFCHNTLALKSNVLLDPQDPQDLLLQTLQFATPKRELPRPKQVEHCLTRSLTSLSDVLRQGPFQAEVKTEMWAQFKALPQM